MKRSLCLLPLLLAAPLYCAEENSLVNLLPADSQAFFGLDVHALINSELFKSVEPDVRARLPQSEWEKVIPAIGFDPLHDVDEVLVASTGSGKNPPALIV